MKLGILQSWKLLRPLIHSIVHGLRMRLDLQALSPIVVEHASTPDCLTNVLIGLEHSFLNLIVLVGLQLIDVSRHLVELIAQVLHGARLEFLLQNLQLVIDAVQLQLHRVVQFLLGFAASTLLTVAIIWSDHV